MIGYRVIFFGKDYFVNFLGGLSFRNINLKVGFFLLKRNLIGLIKIGNFFFQQMCGRLKLINNNFMCYIVLDKDFDIKIYLIGF